MLGRGRGRGREGENSDGVGGLDVAVFKERERGGGKGMEMMHQMGVCNGVEEGMYNLCRSGLNTTSENACCLNRQ